MLLARPLIGIVAWALAAASACRRSPRSRICDVWTLDHVLDLQPLRDAACHLGLRRRSPCRSIGFAFSLGIDAISLWLILLTVGLTPLAIAASFDSIKDRQKEYYAWMLVLLVGDERRVRRAATCCCSTSSSSSR